MREPEPRMPVCAQLLRERVQGLGGFPADERAAGLAARAGRQSLREPQCFARWRRRYGLPSSVREVAVHVAAARATAYIARQPTPTSSQTPSLPRPDELGVQSGCCEEHTA